MKLYVTLSILLVFGFLGLVGCGPQNQAPVAQFDFEPPFPKVNEEVQFNAGDSKDPDASDEISSYKWDFGDGGTGSGEVTTHVYKEAKSYTVKLVVTDTKGASAEATATVAVNAKEFSRCQLPKDAKDNEHYSGLAWDGQFLWATKPSFADTLTEMVYKFNTDCVEQSSFKNPGEGSALAWDGQNLWVNQLDFDDKDQPVLRFLKLNPANGDVVGSCRLSGSDEEAEISAMTWDGRYLWISDSFDTKIKKIDTSSSTCRVVNSFKSPIQDALDEIVGLAWDGQSLWALDSTSEAAGPRLHKMNPTNGNVEVFFTTPAFVPQGLVWDSKNSSFWILEYDEKGNDNIVQFPLPAK